MASSVRFEFISRPTIAKDLDVRKCSSREAVVDNRGVTVYRDFTPEGSPEVYHFTLKLTPYQILTVHRELISMIHEDTGLVRITAFDITIGQRGLKTGVWTEQDWALTIVPDRENLVKVQSLETTIGGFVDLWSALAQSELPEKINRL